MTIKVYKAYEDAMEDFEADMEQNSLVILRLNEKLKDIQARECLITPNKSAARSSRDFSRLGEGLELKCLVELYDSSSPIVSIFRKNYGFDITVPQGGSISALDSYRNLEAVANGVKSEIVQLSGGYLGASLVPLFFTIRGEKLIEEDKKELKKLMELAKNHVSNPLMDKDEAEYERREAEAAVRLINLMLSKDSSYRGLSDREIAKFERHFYK